MEWKGNNKIFRAYYHGKRKPGKGKIRCIPTNSPSKHPGYSWDAVKEDRYICAALNEDYIGYGFDYSGSDCTRILDMIKGKGNEWHCLVLQNPVSKHITVYMKKTQKWNYKDGENIQLACGILADMHSGNTVTPLRVDGISRFPPVYDNPDDNGEYGEIPPEFIPISGKGAKDPGLLGMIDGEGRNDALSAWVLSMGRKLAEKYQNNDTVYGICENINDYLFADGMDYQELNSILREKTFQKIEESISFYGDNNRFLFEKLAGYMRCNWNIIRLDGRLAIPIGGIYHPDDEAIESVMIGIVPGLSTRNRRETLNYLKLLCKDDKKEQSPPQYIRFRNGVFDIETMELRSYTDQDFIFTNMIPWDYANEAYDAKTDHALNDWACGDPEIRALLEECIGYCFYRSCAFNTAFILTGDKSNGKSTFLKVLTALLGQENVAALDLKQLTDRFSTASLFGKLANFGDDISDEFIADASTFKKITDGDRIKGEQKGKDEFYFSPYAKLIFSANDMPRIRDQSGAVKRRLQIIPFNATFTKESTAYNPHILKDLTTTKAMEYLIYLGIQGLNRLLSNNGFTKSEAAQKEKDAYDLDNNPVLAFVQEMSEGWILHNSTKEVYGKYRNYCIETGCTSLAKTNFSKQVNRILGTRVKRMNPRLGDSYSMYVKRSE